MDYKCKPEELESLLQKIEKSIQRKNIFHFIRIDIKQEKNHFPKTFLIR